MEGQRLTRSVSDKKKRGLLGPVFAKVNVSRRFDAKNG
ncbi:hypothetical protein RD1_0985 [Roseobacter denitrificans OCh 114]|uniref:Uncharacterized protein n=1 Tax=Roseobacter denitrificans (strain ATCC 33942 / OCh 114) TaxID=375451 RepID=Q16BJ1_ROSDO|nr:hypothetical protein RD1_0985 [Roseobacter denitrificans OCh 114]